MGSNIPVYHMGERAGTIRARKRAPGTFETFVNVAGQREALRIVTSIPEGQQIIRSAFETYNQD